MKPNKLLLVLFASFILYSCGSHRNVQTENSDSLTVDAAPQILTLVIEYKADKSLNVNNILWSKGILKSDKYNALSNNQGDLRFSFLDENKNVCRLITIPDPLLKKVEYSDDYNTIQSKTIKLDKADITIRIQYDKCYTRLLIEEIVNDSEKIYTTIKEFSLKTLAYE